MTTLGSLFTGYGGLDMGVMTALDPSARVAWTSDIEVGPCELAATRWPDTPNLGDLTAIDWANAEPVDIICGGSPCQDLSVAGKRAGMAPGTRSGLWESMFAAIKTIRPRLVVWENVQGALSARSNSSVEPRPGMLGNEPARPTVRAAGRVVGDLATIGYDACWHVVRAADAGAPHQRGAPIRYWLPPRRTLGPAGATGPSKAAFGRTLSHPSRPGIGDDQHVTGALSPTPQATLAVRTLTETALRFGATS